MAMILMIEVVLHMNGMMLVNPCSLSLFCFEVGATVLSRAMVISLVV